MFSISTQELCSKAESLNSLIQCIQISLSSDFLARKDTFNALGVALDISASIIAEVKKHTDENQMLSSEKSPLSSSQRGAETIGARIRELRKELALTQKQIAERVGVAPSCVTQWESDLITPNCDKLIPLANALGCDPLWLLGK